jgi:F-type H+-transporting ATPase subunit gamma
MATLRELKGRIGSVASSEKITGAMKMISSAKMHKAEQALRQLLPFRTQIESIISNLLEADADFSSALIESREVHRLGIVVLGSDDGLCGAYNVNIFKQLIARINEMKSQGESQVEIVVYPVGAKIAKAVAKIVGGKVSMVQLDVDSKSSGDKVKVFTEKLVEEFVSGNIDRVELQYMQFKSVSRQSLASSQLLPIVKETFEASSKTAKSSFRPYIFEPDVNSIFNSILPMYLLSVMQDVFAENRTSEQAARIMAMQSANDNAKKLLEQLQLEYNKLRQQSITTELLDIVGGQVR